MILAAAAAVAFLLELAAFASLAYWGATVLVVLAVLLPVAAIVVWGLVASPKARWSLPTVPKTIVRCGILLASALALGAAGAWTLALVLIGIIVADQAVLVAIGEPIAGAPRP